MSLNVGDLASTSSAGHISLDDGLRLVGLEPVTTSASECKPACGTISKQQRHLPDDVPTEGPRWHCSDVSQSIDCVTTFDSTIVSTRDDKYVRNLSSIARDEPNADLWADRCSSSALGSVTPSKTPWRAEGAVPATSSRYDIAHNA